MLGSTNPKLGIYRHLDENDFVLSLWATEFSFLTLSAGGVSRAFFKEKKSALAQTRLKNTGPQQFY